MCVGEGDGERGLRGGWRGIWGGCLSRLDLVGLREV